MSEFNWNAKDTQWYVDQENKMMLLKNPDWDVNGDNGKGDAIGRTMEAFFIYGDYRFIEGIESCWVKVENKGIKRLFKKYYYQGYRYPTYASGKEKNPTGMSRDHLFNTILAYKIAGKTDKEMWEFVKHLKWRISDVAIQTLDLWLWERALAGRKFAKLISPIITYITMFFTVFWQLKIEKLLGFGPSYEETQNTFNAIQNSWKPKIVNKGRSLLYPMYALNHQAWATLFYKGKWKKRIQKLTYKIIPKYNYVIKLLSERPEGITEQDIMSYQSMLGGRWSTIFNVWWNDRDLRLNPRPERLKYNVMDVDLLRKLWELYGS